MELETNIILGYLGLINLIALIMFGIDKSKAKRGGRRISEAGLFMISLVGGAFGGLLGIVLFRHKTRKLGFKAIMFIIVLINIYLYYWLYTNYIIEIAI